jgi:hypothetical protein
LRSALIAAGSGAVMDASAAPRSVRRRCARAAGRRPQSPGVRASPRGTLCRTNASVATSTSRVCPALAQQ